jgi:hypothetical protein
LDPKGRKQRYDENCIMRVFEKIGVGKPAGKKLLGRPRRRW